MKNKERLKERKNNKTEINWVWVEEKERWKEREKGWKKERKGERKRGYMKERDKERLRERVKKREKGWKKEREKGWIRDLWWSWNNILLGFKLTFN